MSPIEPTVWDLQPHTKAKHEILRYYLGGWFPILARYAGRIVYIDGFSGPGVYSKGEEGSPVIALDTAYNHILKPYSRAEIVFLFIERRRDRAEKLEEILSEKFPDLPKKIIYEVVSGDFETTLVSRLDELGIEGHKLAPTFAFIDPFGYTGFSMNLLEKLLSYEKCEVFITFMSGFIKRFLDEDKGKALDELFGTDEWRKIRHVEGYRDRPLLELYKKQLKEVCGVKYVKGFAMFDEHNQIIYHLIFCTNHPKGLDVMKRAMWRVDRTGQYKSSDRFGAGQTYLFDYQDEAHWIPRAAEEVYAKFKGQTVSIEDVEQYVITETEYIFKKGILSHIEDKHPERIKNVAVRNRRRRRKSYPDECVITFAP